ncbi:MAG TPA: hypothetical protein VLU24_08400 [Mycobacterium sp.]|nr:hypothetical protein [Mycobacterium sp.]
MVFIDGWWEALPFTVPVAVATQCRQIVCDTFDPARIGVIDRHMQVACRSVVIPRSPRGQGITQHHVGVKRYLWIRVQIPNTPAGPLQRQLRVVVSATKSYSTTYRGDVVTEETSAATPARPWCQTKRSRRRSGIAGSTSASWPVKSTGSPSVAVMSGFTSWSAVQPFGLAR